MKKIITYQPLKRLPNGGTAIDNIVNERIGICRDRMLDHMVGVLLPKRKFVHTPR